LVGGAWNEGGWRFPAARRLSQILEIIRLMMDMTTFFLRTFILFTHWCSYKKWTCDHYSQAHYAY
jgi:hypothetical protein